MLDVQYCPNNHLIYQSVLFVSSKLGTFSRPSSHLCLVFPNSDTNNYKCTTTVHPRLSEPLWPQALKICSDK